jgi:ATP-dependent Zn protease
LITEFKNWFLDENVSSITIPYHVKTYSGGFNNRSIDKVLYSDRFRSISHYIKKYHLEKLYSITENINFENTKYLEDNCNFILLPNNKQKIIIDEINEIYFEITIDENTDSEEDKKDQTKVGTKSSKKYIYKLTKRGKNSIDILTTFLEKVVAEYQNDIVNKIVQTVFEYKKCIIDDDDKHNAVFSETVFQTNKTFDNIFFEDKENYIDFISPFMMSNNSEVKAKYEKTGDTFKAAILLYGPPGCGKSSLIKATIKATGRHCILVPWTKIKTCSDFVSFFRPMNINNRTYKQNELIIVFEDFDANENEIIKVRNGLLEKKKREIIHNYTKIDTENVIDFQLMVKKFEDELTLEYILNVLDGIVELTNTIVFFTTNDFDIIDPALKRSGRINYILKMERATRRIIREMIAFHFSVSNSTLDKYKTQINRIPENCISCSDISEICNNSKTIIECLQKIARLV